MLPHYLPYYSLCIHRIAANKSTKLSRFAEHGARCSHRGREKTVNVLSNDHVKATTRSLKVAAALLEGRAPRRTFSNLSPVVESVLLDHWGSAMYLRVRFSFWINKRCLFPAYQRKEIFPFPICLCLPLSSRRLSAVDITRFINNSTLDARLRKRDSRDENLFGVGKRLHIFSFSIFSLFSLSLSLCHSFWTDKMRLWLLCWFVCAFCGLQWTHK